MKRLVASIILSIVIMLSLATLTLADQPEIVTGQVDLVIYNGQQLVGTIILERDPGTTITTWSFEGTLDSSPVSGNGTATEVWTDNTALITIVSIEEWPVSYPYPPKGFQMQLISNGNSISINGDWIDVPIYISEPVSAPVSGNTVELEVRGTQISNLISKVYPIFQQISTMIRSVFSFILV